MKTKQEIEELAKIAAFQLMTTPDTECAWDEMLYSWKNDDCDHPDLCLFGAYDHYRPSDLLEIFDAFVKSHIKFLEDCQ